MAFLAYSTRDQGVLVKFEVSKGHSLGIYELRVNYSDGLIN